MKKRALILLTLLVTIAIGITAQQFGRRMIVNYGGKVVSSYLLPESIDSLTFQVVEFFNVTAISADNLKGSVALSSNKIEQDSTVTLRATPAEGYRFTNWTVNGEVVSTDRTYLATIIANTEFVANFDEFVPEYVDLGLPSGLKWATCNVGANFPEDYGDYFAWGETEPKDNYSWSTYKYYNGSYDTLTKYCTSSSYGTVDNKTVLELEDDAAYVNWGGNWRMPTKAEQDELRNTNNCTWTWATQNGVNGYKVTSVVNGNSIFLPAAGGRDGDGFYNTGRYGDYWSNSLYAGSNNSAYYVSFLSSYVDWDRKNRYYGRSVRAVYDSSIPVPTPIVCTVTVSATQGGTAEVSATEVENGGEVTLIATPAQGYNFVNWTINGEVVSTENPYTATVTQNTQYIATFVENDPYNGHEYVDLGLPSGLKWATCNVGATTPEDYGDYFAWGEIEPKDNYSSSTYKWCNGSSSTITKYCTRSSYGTVDNKTVLELEDDAAHVNWGGNWRMPTKAEYDELKSTSNCTWEWTRQNGVKGYKVTSVVNGNSIFLPAAGSRSGSNLYGAGSYGDCWSSSLSTDGNHAYYVNFDSGYVGWYSGSRDTGRSVRAVYDSSIPVPTPIVCTVSASATEGGEVEVSATEVENGGEVTLIATPVQGYNFVNWTVKGEVVSIENPYTATITANTEYVATFRESKHNGHEYVDLGLPSGIKWATCNVGATTPEEYGDYFAWGETEPKDYYDWSTYKYCNGSYDTMTKYCTNSSYGTVDNKTVLELEDDAAYLNWGGNWRMPTDEEQKELGSRINCTWTWTTQNGINGYKVTSVVNGNSIFLPAAGCRSNGGLGSAGSYGGYWSSSLHKSHNNDAYDAVFISSDVSGNYYDRYYGHSVRAVCEISTPAPIPIVCTVSVSATEGGTAKASKTKVEHNGKVTLIATPNEDYHFVNWIVNGEEVSVSATYVATITADTEFKATFKEDKENGHAYVDLGLPSGIKWATCNVGATTPEEYGDYFAWGETEPKDYYNWDTYKYCNGSWDTMTKYCTDDKTVLELTDDAANVNWGGNWRMPTDAELSELKNTNNCTWTWTTQNGVNGYKVTSKKNCKSIFLPAAGYRYGGSLRYTGSSGYYWSSLLGTSNCEYTRFLFLNSGGVDWYGSDRYYGHSVRAVCE